jgi:predicted Zn-dependent protease
VIVGRICAALLALAVCAWFVLDIRQVRDTSAASAIVAKPPKIAVPQASRANDLLGSAQTLNPDLTVNVLRGRLALVENDKARALRILKDVVRREPMNLLAWVYIAEAAFRLDEHSLRQALGKIAQLDPKAV